MADPASLEPEGRTVRCSSCAHTWFQRPQAQASSSRDLATVDEAAPPTTRSGGRSAQARTDIAALDAVRAKAQARMASGGRANMRAAWAAIALVVIGAVVAADLFRVGIVRVWPQAASAYALVGRDINVRGLDFADVSHSIARGPDGPLLQIAGEVRNIAKTSRPAPVVRVSARGPDGAELVAWIVAPEAETVAPGETFKFTGIGPAPERLASIEVRFVRLDDPEA